MGLLFFLSLQATLIPQSSTSRQVCNLSSECKGKQSVNYLPPGSYSMTDTSLHTSVPRTTLRRAALALSCLLALANVYL